MNRKEFLEQLSRELSRLPRDERESAVSYYEEFFIEAGDDDEEAVVERLGDVRMLASGILLENGIDVRQKNIDDEKPEQPFSDTTVGEQSYYKESSAAVAGVSRKLLIIILAVVTFPFWFSILMTLIGLVIAGAAVIFALLVTAVALGTVGVGYGIYSMTFAPAVGFLTIGSALIALGVILLIVLPLAKAFSVCIKYIFKGIGRFFSSIFRENGVKAL